MKKINKSPSSFFKRENLFSGATTALVLGFAIVINVIVYVLTVAFATYTPPELDLSLSGYSEELFADAIEDGKKVNIIFCQSADEVMNNSKGAVVHETAKKFAELHPEFIEIRYLNIITKYITYGDGSGEYIDPSKYQTKDEKGNVSPLLKSTVIFESEYGHRALTDAYSSEGYSGFYTVNSSGYAVAYNGEEVIASMVMWCLTPEHKTAYFTRQHGEISDGAFSNMLVCAGYNVKTINLKTDEIPEDAGLVVISHPRKDFERKAEGSNIRTEIERLRDYIEKNGGNLYVALDPYVERLTVLEEFLAEYGIKTSYANIPEKGEIRNIIRDSGESIKTDFFTMEVAFADNALANAISDTVRRYSDNKVLIRDCAALELSGNAVSLLQTSSSASLYALGKETDGKGNYSVAAVSTYENDKGKVGSVFVVPSIYLTASDAMVSGGYSNRAFLYSIFQHVHGLENLPYGCKTIYYSENILEGLTMRNARLYTIAIAAVPTVIALAGGVVFIRRRHK